MPRPWSGCFGGEIGPAPPLLVLLREVNDVMSRKLALTPDPSSDNCDAALAALDGLLDLEDLEQAPASEVTLALEPEENRRLLATAFALDEAAPRHARRNTDDEPTLDARSPIAPFIARITATRPPPLKALVFTSPPPPRRVEPPAAVSAAPPRIRPAVQPVIEKAPHDPQLLVVAGIWAMALSLMVTLAVIVIA